MAQPQMRGNFVRWNAEEGHFYGDVPSPPRTLIVSNGSLLVFDTGHLLDALVTFKPKYMEVAVPMGCGTPQIPAGMENLQWQVATKVQLLFEGELGLRLLTLTSRISLNSLARVWLNLGYKAEIQRGMIAVCRLIEPEEVPTDFGKYYGPELKPFDYTERDEATYGPRLTPQPPPILPTGHPGRR